MICGGRKRCFEFVVVVVVFSHEFTDSHMTYSNLRLNDYQFPISIQPFQPKKKFIIIYHFTISNQPTHQPQQTSRQQDDDDDEEDDSYN